MRRGVSRAWLALLLVSAAGLCAFAAGGAAAAEAPMRFAVVRSLDAGCEPTCPEWIMADGSIDVKAPGRFKTFMKPLGERRLPMLLSSTGGDFEAAMALGRLVRKTGLRVSVARTALRGCRVDEKDCGANAGKGARYLGYALSGGSRCQAQCALVLAGGVRRTADAIAAIGRLADIGAGKKGASRLVRYLEEMGVDRTLFDAARPGDMAAIKPSELISAHLLTGALGVELVTAGAICKTTPAPDNCRVFTVDDLAR